jgi:P4 family phage/plasmid primase-like protien
MLQSISTSPDQFEQFLKILPHTPVLIPIISNGKKPEVQAGESWKDPKYHLTVEQAIVRLCEGKNVGVVANDWLVIIDLDNPEKFKLNIKTLTVETRNGKLHMYYQNAGDVENAVGKNSLAKCGEARAEWQYVLAPGSFVPCDDEKCKNGTGLYHIIDPSPLAVLKRSDLPEDFIPTSEHTEVNPEVLNAEYTTRNKYGWSLDEIRKRDTKLNDLLNNQHAGLPSGSEADMSTLAKLLFWEFTEGEAVAILKKTRYRPKLDRADYITSMLGHISRKDKISDKVDPKKWNPQNGYMIELHFNNEQETQQTTASNRKNLIALLLEILKKEYRYKTPTDTEELHYYKDGIYNPCEHVIKNRLEKELGSDVTTSQVDEVLEHLRWHSYVERDEFNKYGGYIPFNNGLLELETLKLHPFNPDQVFTYKLTDNYNIDDDCPAFKKWLSEVQTPDNILLLQEYAGYCLLPSMPFHKSMWFVGEGRNGKTTYMNTLEAIIGKQNISSISLQALNGERNFIEYEFYGKLVNISSEPTTKRELETPLFKRLTGNDYISAEVKNRQKRVIFQNFAKFYILGNKYPRVRDNTTAFKQRIIIVKWEKQFLEGINQIQNIEKQWLNNPQERSGIINWMLQGLQRLNQNGRFSMNQTQEENMLEFLRNSDSIAAWIQERLLFNREKHVEREEAMTDYMEYCDYYGIYQAEKKQVFDRLRNTARVRDAQAKSLGKMLRVWKGIELKPKLVLDEEQSPDNSVQKQILEAEEAEETGKIDTTKKNIINNISPECKTPASTASSASKTTDVSGVQSKVNPQVVEAVKNKVCGICAHFHLPSCQHPMNFEVLKPTDHWAYSCRGFMLPGGPL